MSLPKDTGKVRFQKWQKIQSGAGKGSNPGLPVGLSRDLSPSYHMAV